MSQNASGGRSRPRRTAAVAVAAGSSAITTAPWLAGVVVSAKEVSRGKPTTTPPATTARRAHCAPRGSRCRVSARAKAARMAATTARPEPMNSGARPATATLVNGTVKEKAATPTRPHQSPVCRRASTTGRIIVVALLLSFMNNDSSSRIVAHLKKWIATGGARVQAAVHPVTGGRAPGQSGDGPEGTADPHGAGRDREPARRGDLCPGCPDGAPVGLRLADGGPAVTAGAAACGVQHHA